MCGCVRVYLCVFNGSQCVSLCACVFVACSCAALGLMKKSCGRSFPLWWHFLVKFPRGSLTRWRWERLLSSATSSVSYQAGLLMKHLSGALLHQHSRYPLRFRHRVSFPRLNGVFPKKITLKVTGSWFLPVLSSILMSLSCLGNNNSPRSSLDNVGFPFGKFPLSPVSPSPNAIEGNEGDTHRGICHKLFSECL